MPDACALPMAAALCNQEPSPDHSVRQDSSDLAVVCLKIKPANQDLNQHWTEKTGTWSSCELIH